MPARAGETLVDLSKRSGNAWNVQLTAVMNAIYANQALESGQLIKVAIATPYGRGSQPLASVASDAR